MSPGGVLAWLPVVREVYGLGKLAVQGIRRQVKRGRARRERRRERRAREKRIAEQLGLDK